MENTNPLDVATGQEPLSFLESWQVLYLSFQHETASCCCLRRRSSRIGHVDAQYMEIACTNACLRRLDWESVDGGNPKDMGTLSWV